MSVQGFLNQTVQLAARASLSDQGRPVYGTAVSVDARVEPRRRMMTTKDGQQVTSTARIYLSPETSVSVTDQITLPDGSTPEIIDLATVYDGNGEAAYRTVYV